MKRRKLWVTPVILLFSAGDGAGQVQQGSACGESAIRYGADCGIRNYGLCRPRNVQDCAPVEIGHSCYPGTATEQEIMDLSSPQDLF